MRESTRVEGRKGEANRALLEMRGSRGREGREIHTVKERKRKTERERKRKY